MKKEVVIYTDGACRGNPGPGGWGAILRYGDNEKEISGSDNQTTNNRMELQAAIEALKMLKVPCKVTLFTDSTYVLKGITEWLPQWKMRGWKTADKKEVKNADLWQLLDRESQRHEILWKWVKGHNGDEFNERADQLAVAAIPRKEKINE